MNANNVVINGQSYAQLQTVLPVDQTVAVDPLNGRQGDNQRDVYIQLLGQGNRPRPLKGGSVDLEGRDSEGIVKQTNTAVVINDRQGLVRIDVPKQFYQAAGDYESAFLRVRDENGKVVSSIGITMTVVRNALLISASESTMYLKSVDDIIQEMSQRVEDANVMAKAAQDAAHALSGQIDSYIDLVNKNAVARLGMDNTWTGKQTFGDIDVNGTLTANKLAGQAMDDILSAINAVPRVTTTKGTTGLVFGNGISKSNDGNSLIVSRTDFGNGQWIISGSGTVKLDLAQAVAGTIQLPWNFGKGNAIVASSFDYSNEMRWQIAGPGNGTIEMKLPTALKQDAYWINFIIASIAY